MDNYSHLIPIDEMVASHVSGETALEDTVASCLDQIAQCNDSLNAVVWSEASFVNDEIQRAHFQFESGNEPPLFGVPILVKEIDSAIAGTPNSWGNYRLKEMEYCDTYTSTSVELLREAGAVIVGKTNNPEFALTITTESTSHGRCNNPLDITRNSGGSSGGAAAAVASGMVGVATSSDGGGSSRVPASNCGVFGFKPSRGLIPLGPLFNEAWDGLVCKGLITSRMNDMVRVFEVMAPSQIFHSNIGSNPKPLRIGMRVDAFGSYYSMNSHIVSATEKVAHFLSDQGHHVEMSHPASYDNASFLEYFLDIIAFNTVLDFRVLQQLTHYTVELEKCEDVTQYFYERGIEMKGTDHVKALDAMGPFTQSIDEWFDDFDILITPTCGDVAPRHGEIQKDPVFNPLIYGGLCFPSNISGVPSISVPVKTNHPTGLPVGLQITAARGNDELALRLASLLERDYSDIQVTVPNNITS